MRRIRINFKQILLNVKFICEIKSYFKYQNIQYTIDQNIKVEKGKLTEIKQFVFDFDEELNEQQDGQVMNKSAFILIYLVSNNGKLKIMNRQIKFNELKQGKNLFNHKFDNCPDRNANVVYQIFYQNNHQKVNINQLKKLQKQTHIKDKQTIKDNRLNTRNQNIFIGRNQSTQNGKYINSIQRKDQQRKFMNSLEKKQYKRYINQIPRISEQKRRRVTTDQYHSLTPNYNRSSSKNAQTKRHNFEINQKLFQIQSKTNQQLINQQKKVRQIMLELTMKGTIIQKLQQSIQNLQNKIKTLERENSKLQKNNELAKSTIKKLQQKIKNDKQQNETMSLSFQNNLNRLNIRQSQYKQQIKNLTQKYANLQYEKQKLYFQNQILNNQVEKINEKHQIQTQNLRFKFQNQLQQVKRKAQLIKENNELLISKNQQSLDQINKLKQKNSLIMQQASQNLNLLQQTKDQVSKLSLQISNYKSKLLIYESNLQSQKIVIKQLQLLKNQIQTKQHQLTKKDKEQIFLKSQIKLLKTSLQKQKQDVSNVNASCQVLNKENKLMKQKIQDLGTYVIELEMKIKLKNTEIQQQYRKMQQAKSQKSALQTESQQKLLKLQNQITIKNNNISQLLTKLAEFKQQASQKSNKIILLEKDLLQKKEVIEQVFLITQKYQQKFQNNQKLNKILEINFNANSKIMSSQNSSSPSKLPIDHISQLSRRNSQANNQVANSSKIFEDKRGTNEMVYRIKKLHSSNLLKMDQILNHIEEVTEQKLSLQKQLFFLSNSLQKLHSQTLEQHSSLKGTKSNLQDELSVNKKLVQKMKCIIESKSQQMQKINQKLKQQLQKKYKINKFKQQLEKQLQNSRQIVEELQHKLRKSHEQLILKQRAIKQMEANLNMRVKDLQDEIQSNNAKHIQEIKLMRLQSEQAQKKIKILTKTNEQAVKQTKQLQQLLTNNKLQVNKVTGLFSDVYKQLNNIEKQSNISSFYLIPLRDSIKKVQNQVSPKVVPPLVSSGKIQKDVNNLRSTGYKSPPSQTSGATKNPQSTTGIKSILPQTIPTLLKSPQSKLSLNSKNSLQKRPRVKSKQLTKD